MIGGNTGAPSRWLTGPGHPDADAVHLAVRDPVGPQLAHQVERLLQHGVGTLPDVDGRR